MSKTTFMVGDVHKIQFVPIFRDFFTYEYDTHAIRTVICYCEEGGGGLVEVDILLEEVDQNIRLEEVEILLEEVDQNIRLEEVDIKQRITH